MSTQLPDVQHAEPVAPRSGGSGKAAWLQHEPSRPQQRAMRATSGDDRAKTGYYAAAIFSAARRIMPDATPSPVAMRSSVVWPWAQRK